MAPVHYDEATFRFALNEDAMATEKLAEGHRAFAVDTRKLEDLLRQAGAGAVSCSASHGLGSLGSPYQDDMAQFDLAQAFASNPQRLAQRSQQAPHVYADLSKNFCTTQTESLLQALAHDCGWQARRDAMLAGEPINTAEGRAAMHWLLRMPRDGGQLRQHPVVQAWPRRSGTPWPPRTTP